MGLEMDSYLAHHGIKGQKWGVRRFQNVDGTLTTAGKSRYSNDQYRRDVAVYGKSGARRIQKNVEKRGDSVSGARSKEAQRINSARRRALVSGQVGSGVGAVAGWVAGKAGAEYAMRTLSKYGGQSIDDPFVRSMILSTGGATAASVGKTLGRDGGRAVAMLLSGYDPKLYHHDDESVEGVQNG